MPNQGRADMTVCEHGGLRRKCDTCDYRRDLDALYRVLVRLMEEHFGCPSIAVTGSEKEAWARGLAPSDEDEFDAIWEAIA